MTDEQLKALVVAYGFSLDGSLLSLVREVERETRQEFFRLIQNANNAASSREITANDIDKLVWDKSQGVIR